MRLLGLPAAGHIHRPEAETALRGTLIACETPDRVCRCRCPGRQAPGITSQALMITTNSRLTKGLLRISRIEREIASVGRVTSFRPHAENPLFHSENVLG